VQTTEKWNTIWPVHFEKYQNDNRHSFYVRAYLQQSGRTLELGAGSFRDMVLLNRMGIYCEGVDFSDKSVSHAKNRHESYSDQMHIMNVFNLSYASKSFDASFHNGLLGLFDDLCIDALLGEQRRVTKTTAIITVHNGHNLKFRSYFNIVKETDHLYDIRFFEYDEIYRILSRHFDKIIIIPVGQGGRYYEDYLIRQNMGAPFLLKTLFSVSGKLRINSSERLMCVCSL